MRNHLRQTNRDSKQKTSYCMPICHLPFAADDDPRLNLERLGSLGSTSLLQLLPELLGTVTEDNKGGEDLPQQYMEECPWFACPASTGILANCWVFSGIQHYV